MSRQRNRPVAGRTSNFIANDPNEQVQISELIDGIRQYQDDEYKAMRAEFERVEQLIEPNSKRNNLWETRSLPADVSQIQDPISENQPQFLQQFQQHESATAGQNHYLYVKWILFFFLILFFGVMTKLYLGRFADNVGSILEYLRSKL